MEIRIFFLLLFALSLNFSVLSQQLDAHCGQDKNICFGSTTVIGGNNSATGGTAPYTYLWTPSVGLSCTNCSNPTVTGSVNTTYTLTVTDALSNSDNCQVQVSVYTPNTNPNFNFTPTSCSNVAVQFTNTTSNTNNNTYSWDFGDPASGNSNTSTLINPSHVFTTTYGNGTTNYNVTLNVTNGNGCVTTITRTVSVLQIPDPSLADYSDNTPFVNCGGSNFLLTIDNISTTTSTNTNYNINWGNGATNYNSSTLSSTGTTQNYTTQGYFTIVNTVTGQNGCVNTASYLVFNGSNPSIGLSNPGGTVSLCVPHTLTFPITNTTGNPPGTIYTITTNTGAPSVVFTHPPPADYTHTFTESSCGATGATTPNSFYIRIKAENPCGFSQSTIEPITTSIKPIANFSISPDTIACVNSLVTLTNTSINGFTVDNFGACLTTTLKNWEILPASGWNVSSGNLGSSSPTNNPSTWGSTSLGVNFTVPGTYSISMIVRNSCGNDTIIKNVCIQTPPSPSFTATPITGCNPLIVNFTNTSSGLTQCGPITRLWNVIKTSSTCPIDSTLNFRFISGTNSSSLDPIIRFNNEGIYSVSLSLTNACGTFTSIVTTITVKAKPKATLIIPSVICLGNLITPTATILNCGSNISTYNWQFPGGSPSSSSLEIPLAITYSSAGVKNISLEITNECGTTIVNTTLSVLSTPVPNAGLDVQFCSGNSATLGASSVIGLNYLWVSTMGLSSSTVANPTVTLTNTTALPEISTYTLTVTNAANCSATDIVTVTVNPKPNVSVNSQTICIGSSATLTALGADSYSWNPSSSASNPFTISPIATTNYTVTGTNATTGCTNTATSIVTVNTLPIVNAGPSIELCDQPIANTLIGFTPAGGTWSGINVTGSGVFTPSGVGTFLLTYTYTNPITLCSNSDTMTVSVISPQISNAGIGFTRCLNSGNVTLSGYSPLTGIWTGTGVVGNIFSPSSVGNTILTYTVGSGTCVSTDTIHIQINPLPVVTSNSPTICLGQSATLTANGGDTYSWNSPVTISNPLTVSPIITTNYIVTGTNTTTGCTNNTTSIVTVNPLPIVNAGPSIQLCNQPISNTLTGFSPSGGIWTGTNVTSGGIFTPSTVGNFLLTYTYTHPTTLCVNSDTMTVTVISPQIADAGIGFTKCLNSGNVTLTGYTPLTGVWSGVGVSGNIFTPSITGTSILTFSFGSGTCLSQDTIHILVNPLPVITTNSQTICFGSQATLTANGGDSYSWNSPVTTSNPLMVSPIITTNYIVTGTNTTTGCTNNATSIVTVNPLPIVNAGPSIQLCNQPIPNTLTGYSPLGGSWTGINVTNAGIFTPSGVGSFVLTYTYTDPTTLCINSDTMLVTVISPQIANAGSDESICLNNGILNLAGFSPVTGSWTGIGITNSNGIFNPLISGVGSFVLTLTYGSGTCFTSDSKIVTVLPLPIISAGLDKAFCRSDATVFLGGSPTYGTWSGNGIINTSSGEFDPNIAGDGIHILIYSVTDPITLCVNTDTLIVTVNPLPTANFSYNLVACLNAPQTFTNNSLLGNSSFWIFENLNTSTSLNPIYTFTSLGIFPIELIETSLYGCKDTIVQFVEVKEPPLSIFTVSTDSICAPALISFVNSSLGFLNTYLWDFGNNTTSTLMNPSAVLYQEGLIQDTTYFITLEVTNYCGVSSLIIPVKVMPTPKSIFGTDLDSGCSPLLINFTNNSLGLPDNYTWDYGDGSISSNSNQNSSHIFTTSQYDTTFVIHLIETNECGVDTSEYSILVHPNNVNAFFNTNVTSGCSPLSVDFTNFSTNNIFYNWDFDDGNSSTLLNPSHTFGPGNYNVALYINNGCSFDTAYMNINAFPVQTLNFEYAPDSICINKPFIFTNLSTGLASSTWDFGDGSTSILTDPTHSFATSGIYTVNLVGISATNGCMSEISHEVHVKTAPVSNFVSSINNGCIPIPITFNNTSINSDYQFWDFGDGNTSNQNNPIHIFETPGTYTVKEVSTNLNGCQDSISHIIIAYPLPVSSFTITESNVCVSPLVVTTSNNSIGATGYTWDFNNGTNQSFLTNPISIYPNSGSYTISLISENIFHCKDTSLLNLTISPILDVSFTLPDDTICRKEVLIFNSNVNFGDSVVWDFGDGTSKVGNPVWNIFPNSGVFNVSAIAYANNGCTDTSSFSEIVVLPSPTADFSSYNIEIDQAPNGTIQFTNASLLATSYVWDFGDGNSSIEVDPIYKYLHNNNVTVTLYAMNNFGCSDTISKLIEIDFFYGLFIPSTMYPGHETFGVANFVPIGVGLKEFEILIYDDWGNIIWQSTALDEDGRPSEYWNGLFDGTLNTNGNGSGRPVQQDAYVWKATGTFIDGSVWQGNSFGKNKFKRNGTITVIR